uniref:Doublecortin-like and CAM kinase-like protein n=1 Tax=Panagrolaimus sp. ES5 TaxID=591445 RepID=A0AC34FGV9_9BILA
MHDVYSEVTPRNTLPRGHRPRPRSSFYRNPKTSEIKNEYPSDSSSTTLISVDLNKAAASTTINTEEEKRNSRRSLYSTDLTAIKKTLGSRRSSVNGSSSTKTDTDMEEPSSSSQKEDNVPALRCFTTSKAKRVRFYRNGDQFFKGIWYAVPAERFRSLKVLMEELNRLLADAINLPHGVRHIFTLDGMMTLESVEQFKDGQSYVCSSSETFKPLNYLSARQPVWCSASSKPQANRSTSHIRNFNFVREPNEFVYPRIITIIRNGVKPRRVVRHLLNKKTAQSFDQVMQDITAIVKLDCGLVRRLFTIKGRLVTNLQDFFGEDDVFIAYGNEKTSIDDFYIANDESRSLFSSNTRKSRRGMGKRALPLRNDSIRQHPRGFSISTNNGELPELPSPVNEQFELIRVLGDGNTAIVYEALGRDDAVRKALKVILKENITATRQYIDTELALMKELSHENIVHMYQYWLIDDSFFVSLELVPDGDLFECLRTVRSYGEREASNLVRCLASALNYIHFKQIVHRDVKPENLLVYVDPNNGLPALKLADFGLASVLEGENLLYDVCGTPTYVAPEILAEFGYNTKVDIWSAGIIIYVLLCGFPPFMSMEEHSQDQLFEQILRGRFGFPSPIWDNISYSAKALIQGLLNLDVEERFSAEQILDYHWVKGLANVHEEFEEMARVCVEARLTQEAEMDDVDAANGFEESNAEYFRSRRASMDELSESQGGNRYSPLAESEASFTAVYTPRK